MEQKRIDCNPFLTPPSTDCGTGSRGHIEGDAETANIVWQTRTAPPTAFENRLGDALGAIFDQGVEDLPTVVHRLNDMGVTDPKGEPWTERSFQDEMKRLGR